ncbi:hypothetical protein PoB_001462300 [Plakobranchus ocellatus]|uniref:ADF-H domain-containing protein n=1 Tax=Plakobranchus ocellatus TaxID=259542 RepID=A0AAV3Z0S9_9GAST|nr:hypothetical protein PoB_001462300 [Plakobranchus ocellatus]
MTVEFEASDEKFEVQPMDSDMDKINAKIRDSPMNLIFFFTWPVHHMVIGHGAGGGARIRYRRVHTDLKVDSLATVSQTSPMNLARCII